MHRGTFTGGPAASILPTMEALVIVGVIAVIALGIWWAWQARKKRREAFARLASQVGLTYAAEDPFGLVGLPFTLFGRGEGRGTENVLWGTWQDLDLKCFDYWYYEESTDSEGHRSRNYYRFSCAVTTLEADCHPLTISRENIFTRLADHMGFRDIEFELEEFNRAFQVKCKDRKFANDLVDARMIQWLLQAGEDWSFEVAGPYVLCFSKRRRPEEMIPLLGTLQAFRGKVPGVVYSLYGTAGRGADPNPTA
jgi:hypothetical protein